MTTALRRRPAFRSFGEQLQAVAAAAVTGRADPWLALAAAGMSEQSPEGGGFSSSPRSPTS